MPTANDSPYGPGPTSFLKVTSTTVGKLAFAFLGSESLAQISSLEAGKNILNSWCPNPSYPYTLSSVARIIDTYDILLF